MCTLNILKKGTTSCAKLLLITPSSWSTVTQMICLLTCLLKPYLPGKLSHTLQLLAFTLSFPDHSFPPCVFTIWGCIALFSFFTLLPLHPFSPPSLDSPCFSIRQCGSFFPQGFDAPVPRAPWENFPSMPGGTFEVS